MRLYFSALLDDPAVVLYGCFGECVEFFACGRTMTFVIKFIKQMAGLE